MILQNQKIKCNTKERSVFTENNSGNFIQTTMPTIMTIRIVSYPRQQQAQTITDIPTVMTARATEHLLIFTETMSLSIMRYIRTTKTIDLYFPRGRIRNTNHRQGINMMPTEIRQ